jgi:uncharacterized protein YkwD
VRLLLSFSVLLICGGAARATNDNYLQVVVELVNLERWNNGQLPPFKKNDRLDASASGHSNNMAQRDFFAHCDPDTRTEPWDRMTAAGYSWWAAAENIAAGQGTPQSVMNAWMNSSGHRSNILSTNYRDIGVGYVYQPADLGNIRGDSDGNCVADTFNAGPFRSYWTQNFGRSSEYPMVINREDDETEAVSVDLYVYGQGFAQEMRFQNENAAAWSAWEPYAADRVWNLSTGSGIKQVSAQIRNGSSVHTATDTILLIQGCSVIAQDHYLHLPAQNTNSSQNFSACNTLYAGAGGFSVQSADVTFRAPRIALQAGFSVAANAVFSVVSGVP